MIVIVPPCAQGLTALAMVMVNGNNVFIERLKSIRKMLYCIKNLKHDIYMEIHPIQYLRFIFRWQKQ